MKEHSEIQLLDNRLLKRQILK